MKKEQLCAKAWEATVRKSQAAARRRMNSFFPSISVANVEDDDGGGSDNASTSSNREVFHAERLLPSGDFYTGQWVDNVPHGIGKYLWTDGCMYVGEWYQGTTMGRGKFSWPSGAVYEGEFKTGYMDGKGTYVGTNGDTYRGSWVMNLRHGHGVKNYANGDCYEGDWRRGLQDGKGKYQWKNGNHYTGQWKNGAIHGTGVLVWTNGNCYDGSWEDGLPKGNGTYRWDDGSFYHGNWSVDPKEQSGTYCPCGASPTGSIEWDPQDVFTVDLVDCKICPNEKLTILPSQKALDWTGIEVKRSTKSGDSSVRPRRLSVDARVCGGTDKGLCVWDADRDPPSDLLDGNSAIGKYGDDLESLHLEDPDVRMFKQQLQQMQPRRRKKQGVTISKGHRNYELMLNLQLGIRHSVGRPAPNSSLDLKASAFDPKEKIWTRFPPEGSKHTPPHQSCDFRWKDYCPLVFRTLRKLFNVDPADYMLSICGNDALRELSSPGKSGSFFYLTNDDRYMIKTMKKSEVKVLLRMLPAYYNHVRAFEHTLVTKFFGLHCVKLTGATQRKVRFVIMGNLFCTEYSIHRRFDLKGSSHGRTTDKPEEEIDEYTTLKDLDLNFIFRLQKSWFQEFLRQVDRDCDFLEQERIMDYSLLVGVHFRDPSYMKDPLLDAQSSGFRTPTGNDESENDPAAPRLSKVDMDQLLSDPARLATVKLGISMPARVEQTQRRSDCEAQLVGEPTGEFIDVILFFGIIDILQDYDISKKLEHAYKSIQYDPTSISAVDPRQYSRRFRDFIFKVFLEDI